MENEAARRRRRLDKIKGVFVRQSKAGGESAFRPQDKPEWWMYVVPTKDGTKPLFAWGPSVTRSSNAAGSGTTTVDTLSTPRWLFSSEATKEMLDDFMGIQAFWGLLMGQTPKATTAAPQAGPAFQAGDTQQLLRRIAEQAAATRGYKVVGSFVLPPEQFSRNLNVDKLLHTAVRDGFLLEGRQIG